MNFALTGNEVQIEGFAWVIHHDFDIDEEIPKIEAKLRKCFEGETAHKITRVYVGSDSFKSFYTQAGFEDIHIPGILEYIRELHQKGRFPLDLRFMNYVTYTPLTLVENKEGTP